MIHSMTGFGRGRAEGPGSTLTVELRAVNHRFLELKTRLPRELAALERRASAMTRARLGRGSVELSVRIVKAAGEGAEVVVDQALARRYLDELTDLTKLLRLSDKVSLAQLARAEGVVQLRESALDEGALWPTLEAALGEALDKLCEMRAQEGAALKAELIDRAAAITAWVDSIEAEVPVALQHARARLEARMSEVFGDSALVEPARLTQEIALLVDKTDVSEEISRLRAHLAQVGRFLEAEGPIGRKLDFLVQELNRETNTIGSKCQSADLAHKVVELKAEIERVREQVQNIE